MHPFFSELLNEPPFIGTEQHLQSMLPEEMAAAQPPHSFRGRDEDINYVICYLPRSGSTHLISLLRNTGVMGKPADFFNLEYDRLHLDAAQLREATGVHSIESASRAYGIQTVADYFALISRLARTPNGVFGLKADLYQASILLRRGLFWHPDLKWKYIYLTREDVLMQAISYYTAIETACWSSLSPAVRTRCEFSEDRILSALNVLCGIMRRWEYVFAVLGIAPLRLTYEQLESDPGGVVSSIASHLGWPRNFTSDDLRSNYRKQRDQRAAEWADRIRAKARQFEPVPAAYSDLVSGAPPMQDAG
jgi:trehalose 2-sulfotransferase